MAPTGIVVTGVRGVFASLNGLYARHPKPHNRAPQFHLIPRLAGAQPRPPTPTGVPEHIWAKLHKMKWVARRSERGSWAIGGEID